MFFEDEPKRCNKFHDTSKCHQRVRAGSCKSIKAGTEICDSRYLAVVKFVPSLAEINKVKAPEVVA